MGLNSEYQRLHTDNGRGKLQYNLLIQQESIGTSSKLAFYVLSEPFHKAEKFLKEIMHFRCMTFMATSWHKTLQFQ